MRFIAIFLCALLAAFAGGAARAQTGFDRHGGDYLNFQIHNGDPAVCAARCERDARCRAWSFAYPRTVSVPSATCWLKNKVPPRSADPCCVSGVRGAGAIEPRRGSTEFSIDRWGGDYRNFDTTADAAGATCKSACEGDNRCRAWTYRRAGYGVATPHCYLKGEIKPPRHQPCCISGVVR
ncbi:MAG TPA: PAN domain-containing protein [Pseudolabrys sp.]